MKYGHRIKQAMEFRKMTPSSLSKALDIPSQNLNGFISRGSRPRDAELRKKLVNVLDVRSEWLDTGIEPMVNLIPSQQIIAIDHGSDKSETHNNILRYDVRLSAGKGTAEWIVRESDDDPLFFRKGWFKARHLNAESLRALSVRGDSMEPYLFNHDTVIIDIDDIEMTDGDTYAVIFKDKFYVKELSSADGEARIISKNAKYDVMQTNKNEAEKYNNYFQILGRVVWRGG